MFKKIKEYYKKKREIQELTLDTLRKVNNISTTLNDIADTAFAAMALLDVDEIKTTFDNINKIAGNRELSNEYLNSVVEQARKEKLKEEK